VGMMRFGSRHADRRSTAYCAGSQVPSKNRPAQRARNLVLPCRTTVGQSSKPPHASLNALSDSAAREALTRCCGATRWVDAMLARRPFASTPALFDAASEIWQGLEREDYLEAFQHHPRIGDSLSELAKRFAKTASMAAREQAKVAQADRATLLALRDQNQAYFERFGYIFIVCATGKSAHDMLALLAERIGNEPAHELAIAAAEQAKITALRLAQLA
jgi:2-oxo-4-hydroxy-4-carboxy-5-ureidoimidazoline decarboxylase